MTPKHDERNEPKSPGPIPTPVVLAGDLTIYRVAELKPILDDALRSGAPIVLDLSEVTDIDGAGIQMLFIASDSARRRGIPLSVSGASPAVRSALSLLSLDRWPAAGGKSGS